MDVARPEAVMVTVVIPGEHAEVEFFADGRIEIERFVSDGEVSEADDETLRRLLEDD